MTACPERAGDLAALALGSLPDAEVAKQRAHLDGCADCRQALRELESVTRLLDLADPGQWSEAPAPPVGLDGRVIAAVENEAGRERRRSRARRWGLAAAGTAAAIALVAGGSVMLADRATPDAVVVALVSSDAAGDPTASATLTSRPWGTEIDLIVEGAEAGVTYRVWLAGPDGSRTPAGTFIGQGRPLRMSLAAGLPRELAVELGVSSDAVDRYLVAPVPT
jgi:hypothetical protein